MAQQVDVDASAFHDSARRLIVGCGYLGMRVARRWQDAGHEVVGVVRTAEHAEKLAGLGIRPILADVTRPEMLQDLLPAQTVLVAVGYDPAGGKSRWEVYVEGLRNVLAAVPANTPRLIFISSTGVYGEAGGGWVDEDSPCRPTREAGRAFLAAEELLAAHPLGVRSIVLRLAGLYGPGRLPKAPELLAGQPMAVPPESYLNLIHVEDAAATVLAAESQARPPRTYVVSDGHPVERREYYRYLAELLHAPAPVFTDAPAKESPHRGQSSKRVRNDRVLREVGLQLAYTSFREGLNALVPRV